MVKITPYSHTYLLKRLSQESRINTDMDSLCSDCGFLVSSSLLPTIDYESTLNQPEDLIYYYHPDHVGSSSYLSDANGLPSQHIEYLPFGEIFAEERDINTNYSTPYKFNSKELDEESGLYYYGARYYSSLTNLFYGVDPLASKYPSWSPFTYVLNNPIKFIDPDGKGPGGPPLAPFLYKTQINATSNVLPKVVLATAAHVFSGPLLVTTSVIAPIVGQVTQGISGGEYPSWAVPYSLTSDFRLKDRPNMMESVSWEDGKELMGALLGLALPPVGGESTAGKFVDEALKEILPEVVKNIPPNSPKIENTIQSQGQRSSSVNYSPSEKPKQVKLVPESWGAN